jgi:hypothetical protein
MADNLNNSPQIRSVANPAARQTDRCESMGQTAAEERPFVWCLMGEDAGQPLDEIIVRKEAERNAGGSFWWGLGTPLGPRVESTATLSGGTLPALFSAKPAKELGRKKAVEASNPVVYLWNGWRSIRHGQRGIVPKHVLVLGGNPDKNYYALVCRSDREIRAGDHGPFDPLQCLTVANGIAPGSSQRAALLTGRPVRSSGRYRVTFEAELLGPWYVRLTDARPLTADELAKVRQFKPGDDWLALCNTLRGLPR